MIDLLSNWQGILGGLVALAAAFLGYGWQQKRKGAQEASQRLSEQDKESAETLRKRVAKVREENNADWHGDLTDADLKWMRDELRRQQDS